MRFEVMRYQAQWCTYALQEYKPGDTVTIAVERNGEEIEISLTLARRWEWMGFGWVDRRDTPHGAVGRSRAFRINTSVHIG